VLLLFILAFTSLIDEVPVFNGKAVFAVRIDVIAGGSMHTI